MTNLLNALLQYLSDLIRSVVRHFQSKPVLVATPQFSTYLDREKKYFKRGDRVETKDGHTGVIWKVYVKIKTEQPIGCSVLWDTTYKGDKVTPLLSVIDKSPKFNPVIRKSTA